MGDIIAAYTSYDGVTWKELAKKSFTMGRDAYIGFAVDATQPQITDIYYNTAKFSNVELTDSFTVLELKLTDALGGQVDSLTPGLNAVAAVTVKNHSLTLEKAAIAIQLCDADDQVLGTTYVQSKFTLGQTKTVKAGFSTPLDLEGLKVKAFVVSNTDEAVIISNEVLEE
ncbi:hypothetical protein D3C75_888340 [compost metagenome]